MDHLGILANIDTLHCYIERLDRKEMDCMDLIEPEPLITYISKLFLNLFNFEIPYVVVVVVLGNSC